MSSSIFSFFAVFAVLGSALFYLRRRADQRFNAALLRIAEEQIRFWRRRLHADALSREGEADQAARHRESCAEHIAALRTQVAALRTGYPRQSEQAGLIASYFDTGLREMTASLSAERLSDFDTAQVRERIRAGTGAFRPPIEVAAVQVGQPGLVIHVVFGAVAGAVLGASTAFYRWRWDASLFEVMPYFALVGALLGGTLAAFGRDTFWEKLHEWWLWPYKW